MWPIDFSDLTDAQLKSEYVKARKDFLAGSVLTGGNAGETGFNRAPQLHIVNRLQALFEELVRRNLTALPMPVTRTTARFRDPVAPI